VPKVDPRRWWNVLTVTVVTAFGGVVIGLRFARLESGSLSVPVLLIAAAVGAGVGLVFGTIVLAVIGRNDSTRFEVSRQLPHALVAQARKDTEVFRELRRIIPSARVNSSTFTVAFDRDGISFWTGSKPERFAFIPARDVREVSVGEPFRPSTFGAIPYSRLKVSVDTPSDTVDLAFALEFIPGPGSSRFNLNEAEIAVIAHKADAIVGTRRSGSTSTTQSTGAMTLSPGTTAWEAARHARIATFAYFLLAIPLFVAVFALARGEGVSGAFPLLLIAIVVIQGTNFALMWKATRSSTRERAAGYTTLNAADLDLPQLNPHTGRVIRPAGGLALSKDEFKRQLLH
jgi:hypothetical protein